MTDQQLRLLVRRYQQHLHQAGMASGQALADVWDQLDQWDEADVERFAALAAPAAQTAQNHAAALAAAFVSLAAAVPTPQTTVTPTPDWRSPFTAYWASLANGTPWERAVTVGRNAADALGFDAVQGAARATTSEIDRAEPAITSWQRIPDGGACDWCLTVAEQTYHSAESADFGHDRCGCSVVPA